MFKARFPGISVAHSVDVSINHAPRFDNARAAGGAANVPDVIQFQTLHNFDNCADNDLLKVYRPRNWDKIFPDHKDPNGWWSRLYGVTFTNHANLNLIEADKAPRDAMDYLEKLVATRPTWVRGTAMPYVAINNGWYAASFTTFWAFDPFPGINTKVRFPKQDCFLTWCQTGAIPKRARNQAAAKLYLNWMLSSEFQGEWLQFPVRLDIKVPGGTGSVLHHNTSPGDFHRWMLKRDRVERFRMQMLQLIGPVHGPTPIEIDYSVKP